jgi:hypothetical protein
MKNKQPRVQKTWKEYKKKYDNGMSIIDGWKIILDIQELLYWIIPHIIAAHWYSSQVRSPMKYKGKRKNRNI